MDVSKKNGNNFCKICEANKSNYVCPRCGIPYCSRKCYQNLEKHMRCSESFYRDCLEQEIRSELDPAKAKKMEEILQRFREENETESLGDDEEDALLDSDDDEPLEKRMEGIDLGNPEEIWKSLTYEEREDFKRFAENSAEAIPPWTPWWTLETRKVLIEEIVENEDSSNMVTPLLTHTKLTREQPDFLGPIPSLSSLTKISPSPYVKFGLANVIGAYVWTSRLFSEEISKADNQFEIGFALVSLSSFLNADKNFKSFREALRDIILNASKIPDLLDGGPGLEQTLEKDVYMILTGGLKDPISPFSSTANLSKSFVLSAISECHKVMTTVIQKSKKVATGLRTRGHKMKPTGENSSAGVSPSSENPDSFTNLFLHESSQYKLDLKVSNKALRKIYYLLAFANENGVL